MVSETRVKLTWLLLASIMILSSAGLLFGNRDLEPAFSMQASKMLLPVALALLHASVAFPDARGALLFVLAFTMGLAFEAAGVRFGLLFGGQYAYNHEEFGTALLGVPVIVPLYWAVFIYLGYSISTSFLVWRDKLKPAKGRSGLVLLLPLIALDGMIVVAVDMFMDPLMVLHDKWFWPGGGPYFGVPLGNFFTWFLITILTTGLFRAFEWRFPRQTQPVDPSVHVAPVVAYAVLCGAFAVLALDANLPALAIIGIAAMMPVVGINLLFFLL
jgi:uncharacterized membrane protein